MADRVKTQAELLTMFRGNLDEKKETQIQAWRDLVVSLVLQNQTDTGHIGLPLHNFRETTDFDVGDIAANGGILASDTTPVLDAINAATDGAQRILWASSDSQEISTQATIPNDADLTNDIVLHFRAAMGGATDTPTIALTSFFNEGDTAVVDASDAVTGTAYAEYSATIATADIPADARTISFRLVPGAHTTDTLAISAVWIEYTRKFATS